MLDVTPPLHAGLAGSMEVTRCGDLFHVQVAIVVGGIKEVCVGTSEHTDTIYLLKRYRRGVWDH